ETPSDGRVEVTTNSASDALASEPRQSCSRSCHRADGETPQPIHITSAQTSYLLTSSSPSSLDHPRPPSYIEPTRQIRRQDGINMSDRLKDLDSEHRPLLHRVLDVARRWRLEVGDPMPSEAQLCQELDAGRQQIREALSALEALGIVASRQGARRTWKGFDLSSFLRRTTGLLGESDEML